MASLAKDRRMNPYFSVPALVLIGAGLVGLAMKLSRRGDERSSYRALLALDALVFVALVAAFMTEFKS